MNASAFKWGVIFGVIAYAIAALGQYSEIPTPENPLITDPYRATGAGFLWGILIYNVREWLISRRP